MNIAARLESSASRAALASGHVFDQLRGRIDRAFDSSASNRLKNIVRPIRVYARPSLGRLRRALEAIRRRLPDKPSIAVLPFQNLSGDPEQDYFADGMVEEIITALSRMRWLFVIARNSSFTYKGRRST